MRANTLHISKKGGTEEPGQQSKESAHGFEPEGSVTPSDPTQLLRLNPNSRSEVNQTTTRDDDPSPEAPTRDLTSAFFAAATGTTVSGPAHFTGTSTTSNQFTVHINPNFTHSGGEQPNPVVLMVASPTPSPPLPVNTVNIIPSTPRHMGTPHSNESTVTDEDPPKDNELYERLLRRKKRGFALYIPQPNRRLPIAYQRIGIRIGDVGIITPDGGFSFLFNICVPHDDPINPRILPEDFSPLQPALTDVDVVEFSRFNSGSYLASASIEKKESESNSKYVALNSNMPSLINAGWTRGLHFETSASEGAVLTMPEGAISLDLENDTLFSDYLEANVWKWYEFVSRVRGRRDICNGQIRLVIGCDKTTAWGIATVSGMSQQTTTKLRFKALDTTNPSTTMYTWECSGMVEERVGPDRHEIDALRNCDNGGHPLDTTLRNQCLFVRTMTATLSNDEWAKLSRNLGKAAVKDSNTSSGTTLDSSLASMPSSSDTKSSNPPASYQGTLGPQSYAAGRSGIMISKMPVSSASYHHPSDDVNQQLLSRFPNCRMAITNDHVWLSTFGEDEGIVADPEKLLEQVLASHDVRIECGVLRLDRNYEAPGLNSSFLSDNLSAMKNFHTLARHNRGTSEDVNENNMADGDVAEVDTGNTPGNRRTNKRPETEENKRKSSLQWTQQGIFTRKPDTLTTIIEEGRPMLNDYLRYAKVGGGQHGEVYLCQRLNPKAGHGDPDRRIPVALKAVKRNNPRAEQLQNLRKKRVPSSPHTVVAHKLNMAEEKIRREIAVMKKLRHAHIVRLYEVINDRIQDKIYIVMEYLGGGEVKWRDNQNRPVLTVSQTLQILRDAVLGLEYLHHQGIIHRDIKPANLLWTEDRRQVKIGDFGVSHFSYAQRLAAAGGRDINDDPYDPILLDESGLTRRAGTPSFLAPEVIFEHVGKSASLFSSISQSPSSALLSTTTALTTSSTTPMAATPGRPQITKSIDIWALGVTLYCLLFGDTPFHAAQSPTSTNSEFSLYNAICNDDWGVPQTMGYDRIPTGGRHPNSSLEGASIINLLDRFLQKNYYIRITLDEVKRHPWVLKGLDDPAHWISVTSPKTSPIHVSLHETSEAMSAMHFRWRWGGKFVQQVSSLLRRMRPLTRQELHPGSGSQNQHQHRQVGVNSVPEKRSGKAAASVHLHGTEAGVPFPSVTDGKKDKGKAKTTNQNQQQHQSSRTLKRPNTKGGSKSLRSKSIERWPQAPRGTSSTSTSEVQGSNQKARRGSDTKIWTGEMDVGGSSRAAPGSSVSSPVTLNAPNQAVNGRSGIVEKRASFANVFQGWRQNKYALASTSTTRHHVVVASPEYAQLESSQARQFVDGSSSCIVVPSPAPNTRRSEEALRYYGQNASMGTDIGSTGSPTTFDEDDPANAGALLTAARRASSWGQGDTELTELVSVQSVGRDLNEQEMNVGAGGIVREGISVAALGAIPSVVAASTTASEAVAKAIMNRRLSITPVAGSGSRSSGSAPGASPSTRYPFATPDHHPHHDAHSQSSTYHQTPAAHVSEYPLLSTTHRVHHQQQHFYDDDALPDDDDASSNFSDEDEEEEVGVTFSPRKHGLTNH